MVPGPEVTPRISISGAALSKTLAGRTMVCCLILRNPSIGTQREIPSNMDFLAPFTLHLAAEIMHFASQCETLCYLRVLNTTRI